ncbi:MAG TPA: hypothetical protein ENH10_10270 [Bacteroidetes bacterium]|nr:hypothetical protein BMS3Bbin04_01318 [bacterium BMS3Bbin04]HDO66391.1 hypothetical protein [Bacteroidota bacterium]HEX05516.1 hypothetical protein [Bacteroidota bacterium]
MKAIRTASLVLLACLMTVMSVSAQVHFTPVASTGLPYAIVVEDATWDYGPSLQAGDEIGIYDGDLCVGAAVVGTWPLSMTAWEKNDDVVINGFTAGNEIYYKLWDQSADQEQPALAQYDIGDALFGSGFGAYVRINSSDFPVLLAVWSNTQTMPASGGLMRWGVHLQSTFGASYPGVSFWSIIERPSGIMTGVQFQYNFTLTPFMHITRNILPQNIPASWAPGEYTLHGHVGFYPNSALTDSFTFTKLP